MKRKCDTQVNISFFDFTVNNVSDHVFAVFVRDRHSDGSFSGFHLLLSLVGRYIPVIDKQTIFYTYI